MDFEKEYKELKVEFDRIFAELYLSKEENKMLEKEVRRMKRALDRAAARIVDLSSRLGIDPTY